MRNFPKTCYQCNESIYFNPDIRKPEDPNKMLALDEAFTGEGQVVPHVCNTEQRTAKHDYQNRQQLESQQTTKKDDEQEKHTKTINTKLDNLTTEVHIIKELLEALIKSQGQPVFQKATNVPVTTT